MMNGTDAPAHGKSLLDSHRDIVLGLAYSVEDISAPAQMGRNGTAPVATVAPTPTRMAVDGTSSDRKAVVSAAAKTSASQKDHS